jgi:integrase
MGRSIHKLSDRFCRVAKPGRYHDGGGLVLVVTSPTARSWLFRWKVDGRRQEMGLGSYFAVGLAQARELAAQARADRAQGRNPKVARASRKAASISFGEAADKLIESIEAGWRNADHRHQWRQTLRVYAAPLRPLPVSEITAEGVCNTLKEIWLTKPETASRVRGRIERVLHWATTRKYRTGANPAQWKGNLEHLLPKQPSPSKRVRHHAALGYQDMPSFIAELRSIEGVASLALQFTVLTAARIGEVIGTTWNEIDFNAEVWTVPAERMKAGRPHRVPLAPRAIEILRQLHDLRISSFVFPGRKHGGHLSSGTMPALMKQLRPDVTVHGCRSSFRQWCAEQTNFPREIAEAALAHINPDEVEAAYQRSDLLERRARLMEAWATFCGQPPVAGRVLPNPSLKHTCRACPTRLTFPTFTPCPQIG